MALDPRIKIVKVISGWGNTSYDVFVGGSYVNNYRLRADAVRAAEARLIYQAEMERSTDEDLRIEFDM